MKKRSWGLIAIVCYKAFIAALLLVTSVALLLALKNYQYLHEFANDYVLEGKARIINWGVEKILNLNPKKLAFSGTASGIYALVTAIEAVGLWYQQRWAHILVLVLVGISIPPEIYEIIRGISIIKCIVLLVNVGVFWYLFRNFPKHHHN